MVTEQNLMKAYEKLLKKPKQKHLEKIISQNAHYSYLYAFVILKKRFPEGEIIISKCISTSYAYARDVIKNRFVLGEEILSKDYFLLDLYRKRISRLKPFKEI